MRPEKAPNHPLVPLGDRLPNGRVGFEHRQRPGPWGGVLVTTRAFTPRRASGTGTQRQRKGPWRLTPDPDTESGGHRFRVAPVERPAPSLTAPSLRRLRRTQWYPYSFVL